MKESERRQALADFLRQRRECLSPDDVGLSPGMRRRTPGLRREEVAQLANVGTSWYVWLEQGRDVHPSVQVLESLAQALRLTPNERRHLFLLAGQSLPPSAVEESVSPALQQVLDGLNPNPAYVMGRRWDFLAWNKAADEVFAISDVSFPHAHNILWRIFTSPTIQAHFSNWEQAARSLLAEFRAVSARYPDDALFEELIEDLKQISPEFCRWWPYHDALRLPDSHKSMKHPELGHLEFEYATMQMLNSPDMRVTIFTPFAETGEKLQRFLKTGAS